MFTLFKQDVRRWIVPQQVAPAEAVTLVTTLKLLLRHMPLRAMFWYRLGAWLYQRRVPFLPSSIQRRIYRRYGLEISVGQPIGGGLYIAHPIGTVISVQKMGQNCSIIAAVTIGMRNEWAFPEIGDEVFVGAGARILGRLRIGSGAVIGANAVVIKDVPAGATAVGVPARVLQPNGKTHAEPAYSAVIIGQN